MYEIDLRGGSVPAIQEGVTVNPKLTEQVVVPDIPYQSFAKVTVSAVDVSSLINNQTKTVNSSTGSQTVTPDEGYTGLDSVTVNPYVLDSSSAVIEENGTYTFTSSADGLSSVSVDVSIDSRIAQEKTVNSSTNSQTVTPDSGYNALSSVTVNPYVLDTKTVDPSTSVQTVTSSADGMSSVTVNAVDPSAYINNQTKTVNSSTNSQTIEPDSGYTGLDSVTVNPYVLDTKTVDPSTSVQTVNSSVDGMSSVTVNAVTSSIDSNIQAANIRKNVNILGVTGTLEVGTPIEAPENDVIFIDYDGTILYSYTKAEFLALTDMPANPEHTGLVALGWNWTLSGAKSYVTTYKYLVIGQQYRTDDGLTRINLYLYDTENIDVNFYLSESDSNDGTTIVHWDDGTQTAVVNDTRAKTATKEMSAGIHTIEIESVKSYWFGQSSLPFITDHDSAYSKNELITSIECSDDCIGVYDSTAFSGSKNLNRITTPSRFDTAADTFNGAYSLNAYVYANDGRAGSGIRVFNDSGVRYVSISETEPLSTDNMFNVARSLRMTTFPTTVTSIGTWTFGGCRNMTRVSIPDNITGIGTSAFSGCSSLQEIKMPSSLTSISDTAFSGCSSLKYIDIPSGVTSIGTSAFNACASIGTIHSHALTAPSLGSNAFGGVPSSVNIIIPCGTFLSYIRTWGEIGNYSYEEGCTEPIPDPSTAYLVTDGAVMFDTGSVTKAGLTFEFFGTLKDNGGLVHGSNSADYGGIDDVNLRIFALTSTAYCDLSKSVRMQASLTNVASGTFPVKMYATSDGHLDITGNGIHRTASKSAVAGTATTNLCIFGAYSKGSTTTFDYAPTGNKLYYVRIWENGTVVKHFVPAKDQNDVVCMHELKSDTYIYNLGTGTPTLGYDYTEIVYDNTLPW